jgi:protein-S-isoprenylcysteine O-methyltransferase Ste14
VGKILYGLLFVVLLPVGLVAWAHATNGSVDLPTPQWPVIGWALAGIGAALVLESMRELWFRGGGLPMNAYPPVRLVSSGVYALVPHPIYVGFCAVCLGTSLAAGSSGGVWLVTPMAIVGCVALIKGYEGPALRARFADTQAAPLLRPPEDGDGPPSMRDRLVVYPLLFLPWLVLYEGWGHAQPAGMTTLLLPGEGRWPVLEWTTVAYSLAYPVTLSVPLLVRRRVDLRAFFDAGVVAVAMVMLLYVVVPVQSPLRPLDASAPGGWLLALERSDDVGGAAAFPSFHVVWSLLAACAWSRHGRVWGAAGFAIAIGISVACATTGMHSVADIAAGWAVAALAWQWPGVWSALRHACERIANSWSCLRIGPVRVINYAGYAGLAAGVGMFLAASLSGPEQAWRLGVIALAALVCAGVWGQALVGSPALLRPFGYFGSILGATAGLATVGIVQGSGAFWLLSGAMSVAAPWVVAIGRLRCLVQGCCHGSPAAERRGIHYRHPLSRVCRIAHLQGVPLHPTPLYSMVANVVTGLLLTRLWFGGAALSLIAGVYLLLAGITRFVEESRRGEPQTQVVSGLRIYQWLAITSALAGGCVTAIPSPPSPGSIWPSWEALAWAAAVGAAYAFAMGVDFPESNRRFSRLT